MTKAVLLALLLGVSACTTYVACPAAPSEQSTHDARVAAWQKEISAVVSEHDRRLVELEKGTVYESK